jgi:HlyD family secretion protein
VNPAAENGQMTMLIALDNPKDARLRANMKLDVFLVTEQKPDVMRVKMGPFTSGAGVQPVFVIDGGKARRVDAELGISNQSFIEVISGLKPGDRIIISNMEDYRHVETIRISGQIEASVVGGLFEYPIKLFDFSMTRSKQQ